MNSKLFNQISNIVHKNNYIRLHMPGHKGRDLSDVDWFNMDLTEIPGTDNLINPNGVLLEIMKDIASIYQVKKSFILVNGSTVGILAALFSSCSAGEAFIIPRSSHKSVYSAILLNSIEPIYLYEDLVKPYPSINFEEIERAFIQNPNAKGIVITSPTYHGVSLDIKSISQITDKYNKILIVDEAHGAHLKFHSRFPKSSVELGADIVVQSTHKTLNSFNQGALLHLCSNKVSSSKIAQYISMLQTSSPSYPIMISIEKSVKECYTNSHKLDKIFKYYDYVNKKLKDTEHHLISEKLLKGNDIFDFDKMKLYLSSGSYTGGYLAKLLRLKYNIQIEMCEEDSILAIMGVGTQNKDILSLVDALKDMELEKKNRHIDKKNKSNFPKVAYLYHPSKVIHMPKESILLKESEGRISSDFIIPYPPGIPLVVPGEVISREIIDYLKNMRSKEVIGINNGSIYVIVEGEING